MKSETSLRLYRFSEFVTSLHSVPFHQRVIEVNSLYISSGWHLSSGRASLPLIMAYLLFDFTNDLLVSIFELIKQLLNIVASSLNTRLNSIFLSQLSSLQRIPCKRSLFRVVQYFTHKRLVFFFFSLFVHVHNILVFFKLRGGWEKWSSCFIKHLRIISLDWSFYFGLWLFKFLRLYRLQK